MNNNESYTKMRKLNSFEDITKHNDDEIDLVLLLDKSESMCDIAEETLVGFNSFIEREKYENPNILVTLVLFDRQYKVLYSKKPIGQIDKLTREDFYADGCTALYDAIGTAINNVDKFAGNKVLFVITTDGLENSSMEYNFSDINKLIENHNWEFLFIGANIDSYSEAGKIGITPLHSANYTKSQYGVNRLFNSISLAIRNVRNSQPLSDNWKRDLS